MVRGKTDELRLNFQWGELTTPCRLFPRGYQPAVVNLRYFVASGDEVLNDLLQAHVQRLRLDVLATVRALLLTVSVHALGVVVVHWFGTYFLLFDRRVPGTRLREVVHSFRSFAA